ncbi:BZ3500_MvSof-1268-A1-R1_Chr8-1g09793 [Microbotryum saponariae]|uniref:BZ3500_MvSof-1268-A1-R1_Chr8-1g09793 protein n=1 Tax=Microbotryum saponariae TaxID=289078 RepID=A0A2X0LQ40_9BASI|nr:BZ3500_MvSof-1268-A1-R1_Chr8-1g09793 [Microbotryum saponariae]SDA08079.1 BZ3501_MvSof-1269-A2-R1_Chr8-1g09516 [Microbotryum saponariae]
MSTYPPIKLSDGKEIPGIGYGVGTAWFGRGGIDNELVEAIVLALKTGYTHIDGAQAYGNETSVGEALKQAAIPREKLFITTKVGGKGLKDIGASCRKSLQEMGINYADLYLIHWPYDFGKDGVPTAEECWKEMEKVKAEGLVKSIGVSNYRIQDLEKTLAVAKDRPVVNQIEFHPRVFEKAEPLFEFSEFSPQLDSTCSGKGRSSSERSQIHMVLFKFFTRAVKKEGIALEAYGPTTPLTKLVGEPLDSVLKQVATTVSSRTGSNATVEPSQVLLLLAHQLGAVVITTSSKEWRMQQQLESAGLPKLTEAEIDEIRKAAKPQQRRFMQHMDNDAPAY